MENNFVDENGEFPRKMLKDYTDAELFEILQNNDKIQLTDLAEICSEVLRRKLHNEKYNLLG